MNYFSECKTLDEAKAAFRKYAKIVHPDTGGNKEAMIELQRQYEAFQKEKEDYANPYTDGSSEAFKKAAEEAYRKYYGGFSGGFYGSKFNRYNDFTYSETKEPPSEFDDIPKNHPVYEKIKRLEESVESWKNHYSQLANYKNSLVSQHEQDIKKIRERNKNLSKENKEIKKAIYKMDDLKRDVEFYKSRLDMVVQPEKTVLNKIKEFLKEI